MQWTVQEVTRFLGGQLIGEGQAVINKISTIQEAMPGSIAFLANLQYEKYLYTTQASAVIISQDLTLAHTVKPDLILVPDPYTSLGMLLKEYQGLTNPPKVGVEMPAHLGDHATLGEAIYRGAFSYIGNHVRLGNGVQIYPHAYIGDHVTIGDHTIIYSGVRIYRGSQIGKHCIIHAGAVIGSDGFGFASQADGSYQKIPQVGHVVLEDQVEIGANTTVDRATLGETRIRQGSKLDNLVQIAHNVEIGEHTVIAALSGIAGSAKIGARCQLGGQTGIAGHITVGAQTTVGGQAGVTKSYPKGHTILMGTPAFSRPAYLKSYAWLKQLPALAQRIEQLEAELAAYQAQKPSA
jgi:UDP-3-O-[3-hydroxymyristoyl] glucosamine N-acyltransferase